MASGGGKKVLKVAKETQPYRTELTPVSFLRRSAYVFGDRTAVLGPNGTGKSHFLRLLAGEPVEYSGEVRLGARVVPGYFSQTHDHPELRGGASALVHERTDSADATLRERASMLVGQAASWPSA